ncbi:thermonuclease family protein [Aeromonas salmonicida]|uniref:thermonuclease family protein n=1 Tax=Aeromonas salmonicida TaxID=645 RepID=UPI000F78E80C|nr:thermonuclease family protein [Aeromonas salmonicida]RSM22600.1 nuclease [Aeromonas salmonicida]
MRSQFFTASLLFVLASPQALAVDIFCRVVGVYDGDTFTCLSDAKQQMKVRMAEIDTPESKQPYGTKSKQALSDLVFGKHVGLKVQDTDRYGRIVARVYVGSIDVNEQLVAKGAAWVYRQYNKDKSLIVIENQATASKRGLWSLPESERMPPWEWRKAGRNQRQAQHASTSITMRPALESTIGGGAGGSSFSCNTRKSCAQMDNCAEAQYQLKDCGNNRLDQDKDGVPCENLCR